MHILFFCHYFPPEGNAPASRTYEHCVRWVRSGHKVTVITCVPNVPNGIPYDGYHNKFRAQRENIDGIEVIRVWTYLAPNAGFLKRILNYLSYMLTSVWAALFVKKADIIIATSPQFFCGWGGVIAQFLLRKPFILEIRDIWPESITTVGAMKKNLVIKFLEWLEKRMYRAADHIVAVGYGYRDNILSKVPMKDKISVIYNGVDGKSFSPAELDTEFLKKYGLDGKFVCAYVGTIGMAHGLETVLDAAAILKEEKNDKFGFLLVGDGARKNELEEECERRNLTDYVRFTGRLAKQEMPKVLASSDALLVHLRACELFETVIPSKIFEAMAMKRPIIMGVKGESAEIVKRSGSGVEMEPSNPNSLVDCVKRLQSDQAFYQELSQHGRDFVLHEFSRDKFADDYLQIMQKVVQKR